MLSVRKTNNTQVNKEERKMATQGLIPWWTPPVTFLWLCFRYHLMHGGLPGGPDDKESACNARDPGFISWRREWLPTPVFLSGDFHGQRRMAGHSPWGHKESDTTERLSLHTWFMDFLLHKQAHIIHFIDATFFTQYCILRTLFYIKVCKCLTPF